jgi:predicted phage tail protein
MNNVYLHGALGKEFGRTHSFHIDTIADAINALQANYPRFLAAVRSGFYRVIVGKSARNGFAVGEESLPGYNIGSQSLHIVPVVKGAKNGGVGKVVAGIALVGLSMMIPGAGVAGAAFWSTTTLSSFVGSVGTSMLLTGIASMIAPEQSAEETKQSFVMSGPENTAREGGIIPIAYGEVITGGTLVNGAIAIRHSNSLNGNSSTHERFLGGNW